MALQDAKQQAETIATSLGANVGKLISASEYGFNNTNYYYDEGYYEGLYFEGNKLVEKKVPITVNVYVTYAVK